MGFLFSFLCVAHDLLSPQQQRKRRAQKDSYKRSNSFFQNPNVGTCFSCEGKGYKVFSCGSCSGAGSKSLTCRTCSGSGSYQVPLKSCNKCDGLGTLNVQPGPCSLCRSTGSWYDRKCPRCNGSGNFVPPVQGVKCGHCDGTGIFRAAYSVVCRKCAGKGTFDVTCSACDGSGKFQPKCKKCGGAGTIKYRNKTD